MVLGKPSESKVELTSRLLELWSSSANIYTNAAVLAVTPHWNSCLFSLLHPYNQRKTEFKGPTRLPHLHIMSHTTQQQLPRGGFLSRIQHYQGDRPCGLVKRDPKPWVSKPILLCFVIPRLFSLLGPAKGQKQCRFVRSDFKREFLGLFHEQPKMYTAK